MSTRKYPAHLIAGVLDFARGKIEGKYSNSIRVLVRNNQKLPWAVKLIVTRGLSASVEEANLSESATDRLPLAAALFHAEDGDGFMSTVWDNDKSARLVDTYHEKANTKWATDGECCTEHKIEVIHLQILPQVFIVVGNADGTLMIRCIDIWLLEK